MNTHLQQAIENDSENGYLRYHAPRYDALLSLLGRLYTGKEKILDVGRSPFTAMAHKTLGAEIDTLGFDAEGETDTGFHYHFDLNATQDSANCRNDLPTYDIVVFSEVIEHLHTSPKRVLEFLRSITSSKGIVILQTPNAVVLHKRIRMALGRNPYSLISEDTGNPAHFREYTARELVDYCRQAGFKIVEYSSGNYFDYRYTGHADGNYSVKRGRLLLNLLYAILPASMRPGLCFVLTPGETRRQD